MKHQILSKSFLFLALMVTFASHASASEATGNLSSAGSTSGQTTTGNLTSTVISSDGGPTRSSGGESPSTDNIVSNRNQYKNKLRSD